MSRASVGQVKPDPAPAPPGSPVNAVVELPEAVPVDQTGELVAEPAGLGQRPSRAATR